MITKEEIEKILFEKIEGTNIFLVKIDFNQIAKDIKIFIDSIDGLDIKDCVSISRHFRSILEERIEEYSMEVSSPGVGEPLIVEQQIVKSVNKKLEITLIEDVKHIGILLENNKEDLIIDEIVESKNTKKKEKEKLRVVINKNLIKEIKQII